MRTVPPRWPFRLLWLAVLGLALAACGRSAPDSPAVRVEPHSVTMSWDASASSVSGYRVYRATSATDQPVVLAVLPADTTQYTDISVEPGKTYFYTVTSFDSANRESVFAEKVSATIPAP